jgi:hypothetical protein
MFTLRTWGQSLLAAVLLLISSTYVLAERSTTKLGTTEITRSDTIRLHERAGNPMLGVLIIIGLVGLLIFVAWIFSRVGEGNSRQSGTLN